jgi:hypothetical protein
MFQLGPRTGAVELGYAEIVTNVATVSGSSSFADVAGLTVTVTSQGKPMIVEAWLGASPTTDTAGGGAKYRIVRTDTGAGIAQADANSTLAGGVLPLGRLTRRVAGIAAGTAITFKVQIAGRTSGVATFGANTDIPIAIRVRQEA